MGAKIEQTLVKTRVIRQDGSTFSGGDVLDRMEGERRHIGMRTRPGAKRLSLVVVGRTQGMGRIFDHQRANLARDLVNRRQVGRLAGEIHGDDDLRWLLLASPLQGCRLHRDCSRIYVHKGRRAAAVGDAVR